MRSGSTVIAFVRLSRLHFLLGGFLMLGLGAVVAGFVHPLHYVLAQLMGTAAQLTAHYVNEYADIEVDSGIVNRTMFSGGSGVLTSGTLLPGVALRAAIATTAITGAAAIVVAAFSPAAAVLGLLALAISWTYSMPPIRLLGTGFGELATAIAVTVLLPLIGSLSQTDEVSDVLWQMIAVLLPVQVAMLLAFELPDLETDAAAGKRVLAVRIGGGATIVLMTLLIALAAGMTLLGWLTGDLPPEVAIGAAAGLPMAIAMLLAARTHRYGVTTACAVAAFAVCGAGMLIASL